jgi:two-component system OmpR family response regulator
LNSLQTQPPLGRGQAAQGASVLILDPAGELVRSSASELLRSGFEVHTLPQGSSPRAAMALAPAITLLSLDFAAQNPAFLEMFRSGKAPVVLIVPKDRVEEGLQWLELWADDMIVEPVNATEAVARVRAVLRRANAGAPQGLSVLGYRIDTIRRQLVTPDGAAVGLTPQQTGVLVVLASTPGVIVSRKALSTAVRRQGYDVNERSIDNQISRLRRKLEGCGGSALIRTAYGKGYAIDAH